MERILQSAEPEPEGQFDSPSPAGRRRRLAALSSPVVVRKVWRGRGKTSALAVSLRTDEAGHNVAEITMLHQNATGRLRPGPAITLAIARLPELAAALVSAYRRAIELALIEQRGPQR